MDEHEILQALRLLNFLHPTQWTVEQLSRAEAYMSNRVIPDDIELYQAPEQLIDCVADEIMKVAVVRDCRNVSIAHKIVRAENSKKKYAFDGVYDGTEGDGMTCSMIEFLEKRITVGKDSSVVCYGGSGSGKSTSIKRLVVQLCCNKFSLCEIYNNTLWGYVKGKKIHINTIDECPVFQTDNIIQTLEKFERRSATSANAASSRSHIILRLYYDNCVVSLFDLCGAEKMVAKNPTQKAESMYINKSLFSVSQFLTHKMKHKDNNCVLLNILKLSKNFILALFLTDNPLSAGINHLSTFAKLLMN